MTEDDKLLQRMAKNFATDGERQIMRAARKFTKGKKTPFRLKTVYIPNKKTAVIQFQANEGKLSTYVEGKVKTTGPKRKSKYMIQFRVAYHAFFVEMGLGKGHRTPRPFLSEALSKPIGKLADDTNNYFGDKVIKAIGSFVVDKK